MPDGRRFLDPKTQDKIRSLDLRASFRQSYYYWNQNDNVALPISTAAAGLSTGLTANHDWATVRKSGSVDLTIHATNNLDTLGVDQPNTTCKFPRK